MFPSSTSNSDAAAGREIRTRNFRWGSFAGFALGVLGVLVAAEGLLHLRWVRDRLPMPNPYYIATVEGHGRLLEKVVRERGGVDVFFMGSSAVGRGVNAAQFELECGRLTGQEVTAFNGWLSQGLPDPARFYYRHFWARRVVPRLVAHGIRYTELISRTEAGNFDRFERGRFEGLWGRDDAFSRFRLWGMDHVRFLYYRSFLPEFLRDFRLPPRAPRGAPLDERGMALPLPPRIGGHSIEGMVTPEQAREIYGYEIAYLYPPTPERCAIGLNVLRDNAEYFRSRGIQYVLFNMPEHKDRYLLTPEGPAHYTAYLALLQDLAADEGIPFIDVTDGDAAAYDDEVFVHDHFHMGPDGAKRFTEALAARFADLCKTRR